MPKPHDDIYISLLKQAKKDLMDGKRISQDEFNVRAGNIAQRDMTFVAIYGTRIASSSDSKEYAITLDAYMSLLEYEELQHSLAESKNAARYAFIAIGISCIGIVLQVVELLTRACK